MCIAHTNGYYNGKLTVVSPWGNRVTVESWEIKYVQPSKFKLVLCDFSRYKLVYLAYQLLERKFFLGNRNTLGLLFLNGESFASKLTMLL